MKFAKGKSQPRAMTLPDKYLSAISFKIEDMEQMVGAFEAYYLSMAREQPGKPVDPATSLTNVLGLFVNASRFDAFVNRYISADPTVNPDVLILWMELRQKLQPFWQNIRKEEKADQQVNYEYSIFILNLRCSFILMFYHKLLTKYRRRVLHPKYLEDAYHNYASAVKMTQKIAPNISIDQEQLISVVCIRLGWSYLRDSLAQREYIPTECMTEVNEHFDKWTETYTIEVLRVSITMTNIINLWYATHPFRVIRCMSLGSHIMTKKLMRMSLRKTVPLKQVSLDSHRCLIVRTSPEKLLHRGQNQLQMKRACHEKMLLPGQPRRNQLQMKRVHLKQLGLPNARS